MDPSHITDGVKSATTVRQTTTIETKVRESNMNGSKTVVHLGIDLGKNFLPSVGRQRAGRAGAEEKGAPEWFVAGGSEYTAVPDWEAEACSGAHHSLPAREARSARRVVRGRRRRERLAEVAKGP